LKKPDGFRAKIFHASARSVLTNLQMVLKLLGDEIHNYMISSKTVNFKS